jgi:disulfide bond formation protein DsbB
MIYSTRRLCAFVAVVSALALIGGLVAQYGFNLRPCILCLTQRVPFALALALGLIGLLPPLSARWRRRLIVLAGLAFLVNSGIAIYHSGVERHWWASPGCAAGDEKMPVSVADMIAQASRPAEVPCDKPAWQWHGLTMAVLNIFYSGGLALVTLTLVRRIRTTR